MVLQNGKFLSFIWSSIHVILSTYLLHILFHVNVYEKRMLHYDDNDSTFTGLQTWMYLAVPVFLYACERLIRFFRSSIKPVKILKVKTNSKLVQLVPLLLINFFISVGDTIVILNHWRLLFIREMCLHCTCLSRKASNTRAGSTCSSTAPQFLHSNGR